MADAAPDTPYLKTINGNVERKIRHICVNTRTLKLPGIPEIYWQPYAIKRMICDKPDVIIALGSPYSITAWMLCILGRILKIQVLLWGHGLLGGESGPKWWLRNIFFRLASGQLLYGDYAKKLLTEKGFDPERLYVVYNSLDYDVQKELATEIKENELKEFRRGLGIKEGEGLVAFTGRLQPVKRLDLLVEALGKLALKNRMVHLALVGDGIEKENLERLSNKFNVANLVHFLGASYDERFIGLVLSASDLCVIPSGAGLSIMHAMAFGTPVLIHDRLEYHFPEWEAVEENKTGLFYKYGDIDDLARKMEDAIFPVPKKAAMALNCKAVIDERYNPHKQLKVFVRAVNESTLRNKR
jgi:glycosyltransferase involved in cell wall biosynthesis